MDEIGSLLIEIDPGWVAHQLSKMDLSYEIKPRPWTSFPVFENIDEKICSITSSVETKVVELEDSSKIDKLNEINQHDLKS